MSTAARSVINNNNNIHDNVCGDEQDVMEDLGDYSQEKMLIYNSLDQFKQTLHRRVTGSGPTVPDTIHVTPGMFDNLSPTLTNFSITPPTNKMTSPSMQFVSETSSRILFLTIHWCRNVPGFVHLSSNLQVSLLRSSWPALFTLGLVQCRHDLDLAALMSVVAGHLQACLQEDTVTVARVRSLMSTLASIKMLAVKVDNMDITQHEFAYLRLCTLFKFSK